MVEDERHGLELDDQGQTVTCAGMALKIKASNEDDYLRSTDQPRQWEAGRARARRSGAWCCAGSGAEFTSGTLESPVVGRLEFVEVQECPLITHSLNLGTWDHARGLAPDSCLVYRSCLHTTFGQQTSHGHRGGVRVAIHVVSHGLLRCYPQVVRR